MLSAGDLSYLWTVRESKEDDTGLWIAWPCITSRLFVRELDRLFGCMGIIAILANFLIPHLN